MERIEGPVRGHYLAAYTVAADDGHFGYAKICAVRPECVWDAAGAVFKVGAGPFDSEGSALAAALGKAEEQLREHSEWQLLWDIVGP